MSAVSRTDAAPAERDLMPGAPTIVTIPLYLAAVQTMHGLGVTDIARTLRVNPSVVRRWLRGTLVPGFRRLKGMTAAWGGDPEVLALGAAFQRYCRSTGVALEEAVRMVRAGRRTGPERRAAVRRTDRRQLTLPMQR